MGLVITFTKMFWRPRFRTFITFKKGQMNDGMGRYYVTGCYDVMGFDKAEGRQMAETCQFINASCSSGPPISCVCM